MVSLRFSLHTLADMFELPDSVVHSTISKMIINEELQVRTDRLIWINCRTLFSVKLHTQIISQITEDAVLPRTCSELAFCCFCSSQASWDEPTQTVVMHRGAEPTLLQSLALQLAEKVSGVVCLFVCFHWPRLGGQMIRVVRLIRSNNSPVNITRDA